MSRSIPAGEGIELRPVTRADADALHSLIESNRARLRQWLPWAGDVYNRGELKKFLEQKEKENALGESLTLNIWYGQELCGSIGMHQLNRLHLQTSVGYWIGAAFEGRGIMTRACHAVVSEALNRYGMHRVEIRCGTGNVKSCGIPRRLGFVEEGILREAELVDGRWLDLRVFSMLDRDWPGSVRACY